MDLQYSKKENELMERIEQLQLEIVEFKNISEDSEMLLKQSVSREISLEEELKVKDEKIKELENKIKELE